MVFNPFIKDGYTGQVPSRNCPVCSSDLDAVTNMTSKEGPEPGDFTVCIHCRSVLRFDGKMELVKSSLIEVPIHMRYAFAKVQRMMGEMPFLKRKR